MKFSNLGFRKLSFYNRKFSGGRATEGYLDLYLSLVATTNPKNYDARFVHNCIGAGCGEWSQGTTLLVDTIWWTRGGFRTSKTAAVYWFNQVDTQWAVPQYICHVPLWIHVTTCSALSQKLIMLRYLYFDMFHIIVIIKYNIYFLFSGCALLQCIYLVWWSMQHQNTLNFSFLVAL